MSDGQDDDASTADPPETNLSDTNPPDSQWLGYELHDGLLQWVMGARLQLQSLVDARGHIARSGEAVQTAVENSLRYLDNAAQEGRQLIAFLESGKQQATPELETVLRRLCRTAGNGNQTEAGVEVVYHSHLTTTPVVPPAIVWNVQRIVQQAIGNALRHAAATKILVGLDLDPTVRQTNAVTDWLRLSVQDDGHGFDVDRQALAAGGQHFGLASMQHRAQLIGGRVEIVSSSTGTNILVTFPVPAPAVRKRTEIPK